MRINSFQFKLIDFLWLYNGRSNVFAFAVFNVILYLSIVIVTSIRAILEGGNGWATAVCVLNICTFVLVTIDARFWSFTNPVSLFFVITAESLCLAANILVRPLRDFPPAFARFSFLPQQKICFAGDTELRVMSVMVLFLVFLQKGSFLSYLSSTVVRAVFRQAHDHKDLVKRLVTGEEENTFDAKYVQESNECD